MLTLTSHASEIQGIAFNLLIAKRLTLVCSTENRFKKIKFLSDHNKSDNGENSIDVKQSWYLACSSAYVSAMSIIVVRWNIDTCVCSGCLFQSLMNITNFEMDFNCRVVCNFIRAPVRI